MPGSILPVVPTCVVGTFCESEADVDVEIVAVASIKALNAFFNGMVLRFSAALPVTAAHIVWAPFMSGA
jgi:hypothetical protein